MKLMLMCILLFWCFIATSANEIDWIVHQKLRMLEKSLIENENLHRFLDIQHFDNQFLASDATKAKRSYDNARCIKALQWIQQSIHNGTNKWALDSKLPSFDLFSFIEKWKYHRLFNVIVTKNIVINSWGTSEDYNADFGHFDQCLNMLPMTVKESMAIRSQYCVLSRPNVASSVGICIPDLCAPTLIAAIINDYLNGTTSVSILATSCQLQDDNTQLLPLDKFMMWVFIQSFQCPKKN